MSPPYNRTSARKGGGAKESSLQHPAVGSELPRVVPSHSDHGAVGCKPHSVKAACGDLDDIRPVADIAALPVAIVSHGDHGAVAAKPHRVLAACGDLDDIRPVAYITRPGVVESHGDHGAVGPEPHRVTGCLDLDYIRPVTHITEGGIRSECLRRPG